MVRAGKGDLGMMLAYNPGLSSAWMLQRAMSVQRQEGAVDPKLINKMLSDNFKAMESLGPEVMLPFLQDVIQVAPLLKTMGKQVTASPTRLWHVYGLRGCCHLCVPGGHSLLCCVDVRCKRTQG
jgi:lycopene cyclase CruP